MTRKDNSEGKPSRVTAVTWNDEIAELVAGGWPVIEAATNEPVDLDAVVAAIRVAGTPSGSIFA